jgi:galactokinase
MGPPALFLKAISERLGGRAEWLVRAPGRVNLIGEHTDYNDGFVLPLAIDRATWIAARPGAERRVHAASLQFDGVADFELPPRRGSASGVAWAGYLQGVAWSLDADGFPLCGWDGVVFSDVPIGAGLSSSAALELAAARLFAAAAGRGWEPARMARLAQRAENEWVGVRCGIMDQLVSAAATSGHALLIDCRSLALRPVPLPATAAILVLDTSTRRGLLDSAYNERRQQCADAARALGVGALRDADEGSLTRARLEATTLRRARHVLSENARTQRAASALAAGDLPRVGVLMRESHRSLRDDFEVSSPALDAMADCAEEDPDCYGARMTGAGFAGCVVALVEAAAAEAGAERIARRFAARTGLTPASYVCRASAGASLEPLPA